MERALCFIDNYAISEYTVFMKQWNSIGEKLRAMRKTGKLTLKDVSKKTGLSISFISEMEVGMVDPSLKTLIKMANFYKTTVHILFEEVEGLS